MLKRSKYFYVVLLLIFGLVLPSNTSMNVFAEEGRQITDAIINLGPDSEGAADICNRANDKATQLVNNSKITKTILVYQDNTLSFNQDSYSELNNSQKTEWMNYLLGEIKYSSLPSQVKNKMYNFVTSQDQSMAKALQVMDADYKPDMYFANKVMRSSKSVGGVISKLLGFLIILMVGMITLSFCIDLIYINLPMFKGWADTYCAKTKKNGKRRHHIATVAAQRASMMYYGEPNLEYFKSRAISFIVLIAFIYLLITGQIFTLTGWLVSYAQTVIDTFLKAM